MYDPSDLYSDPVLPNFSIGPKKKMAAKTKGLYKIAYRPSKAPDKSKPYCIVNKKTGAINGRWHPTRTEALKQLRAMYSNMGDKAMYSEESELVSYLTPVKEFSEWIDGNKKWVQIYPFDTWDHPKFGETTIDKEIATKLKEGFDRGIRGQKILSDYDHGLDRAKGGKASGEFLELDVREDGLFGLVQFTDTAKKEIDDGEWQYFSGSHYDTWTHPQQKVKYEFVFDGGGLTNQPWVKGMAPLNFSEIAKEFADKSKMPYGDVEYADPGYQSDGKKRYPIDTKDHAKAAWSYINQKDNAAKYSSDDLAKVKAKIKSAMDKFGIDREPDEDDPKKNQSENIEEGSMNELETKLREALKLDAEADVIAEAKKMFSELEPLREAAKEHSKTKKFSEQYPEEYERLKKLEEVAKQQDAKQFAETFLRFSEEKDGKKVTSTKGFSQKVVDALEEYAKKFSEREATLSDLGQILDMIPNGIVDYGETGSSRAKVTDKEDSSNDPRKVFSEIVKEIAVKDEKKWDEAVRIAATTHPDEYEAYLEAAQRAAVVPST